MAQDEDDLRIIKIKESNQTTRVITLTVGLVVTAITLILPSCAQKINEAEVENNEHLRLIYNLQYTHDEKMKALENKNPEKGN